MENQHLKNHVKAIADDMHNGIEVQVCEHCSTHEEPNPEDTSCPCCGEEMVIEMMDGWQYLQDALDINYLVSSDLKVMQGARILVAFGGPNIWIDTAKGLVEGYWGGDSATASFHEDPMGVEMAASDLYWAARS